VVSLVIEATLVFKNVPGCSKCTGDLPRRGISDDGLAYKRSRAGMQLRPSLPLGPLTGTVKCRIKIATWANARPKEELPKWRSPRA
jgi:hypothetical protein